MQMGNLTMISRRLCAAAAAILPIVVIGLGIEYTLAGEPLRFVNSISLPDVEGRIDHIAVDLENRHLFVAALGNNSVEIVDLSKNAVVKSIGGLREPQGIALLKYQGAIAVACGEDGKCHLFESETFESGETIDLGNDADNVRYDGEANRVYVGYGSGALGIIDAVTRRRVADVPLAG